MRRIPALVAATALTASLVISAQPASASDTWNLVLKQDKPVIVDSESTDGIVTTRLYEAVLRNSAGKRVGTLTGQQELFEVNLEGQAEQTRLRTLVFDLKGGQVLAQGVSDFPVDSSQVRPGKTFSIAIIGGTGAYRAVRGELVTKLNADGTYVQTLYFVR